MFCATGIFIQLVTSTTLLARHMGMARGTSIPPLRLPLVPDLLSLMKRHLHLVRGSKVVSLSIGCTRSLPLGYLRWLSSSASHASAASIHSKAGVSSGRRRTVNRSSIMPSPVGVIITLESLVRLSNPVEEGWTSDSPFRYRLVGCTLVDQRAHHARHDRSHRHQRGHLRARLSPHTGHLAKG